jgi:hypothetical protein
MVSAEAIANLPDLGLSQQFGHNLVPATDLLKASQHIQFHPGFSNGISAIVTTSFSVCRHS